MGTCCSKEYKQAPTDSKEAILSNINTIGETNDEYSSKQTHNSGETDIDAKFFANAERISSQNPIINVFMDIIMLKVIMQKLGLYVYEPNAENGINRVLKEPETLENGDIYYGFW